MATDNERSTKKTTLHNFSFPNLKWASKRFVTCIRPQSDVDNLRLETELTRSCNEEGIEGFREKIMSDIRTVADLGDEEGQEHIKNKERAREEIEAPVKEREGKPWNLRKRRESENFNYNGLGFIEEKRVNSLFTINKSANSTTRMKFVSTLSKKEFEEDCIKILGHRPPRRPKKRPRTIQKQINMLYPAFYFTEINHDIYKVIEEVTEKRKR